MRDTPAQNVDAYLAAQPAEVREALERLRQVIRSVAPGADEVISYGMPMFKYHGMLAGYAAFKNHCGFYPGAIVTKFQSELANYPTSKGTIRFTVDNPLPAALIKKIIKARMKENTDKQKHKL